MTDDLRLLRNILVRDFPHVYIYFFMTVLLAIVEGYPKSNSRRGPVAFS